MKTKTKAICGAVGPTGVVVTFPDGKALPPLRGDVVGDQLREAFVRHHDLLIRFLHSRLGSAAEAQDVAQDAIFRLYSRRQRLVDQDLRALLFVTARNIATDRLRERRRSLFDRSGHAHDAVAQAMDESASPERIVAAQQKLQLVKKIVGELPSKCQQAFICYKFEGLDYAEIAAHMKVTESMVRKHVIKALAHCAARFSVWEGKE